MSVNFRQPGDAPVYPARHVYEVDPKLFSISEEGEVDNFEAEEDEQIEGDGESPVAESEVSTTTRAVVVLGSPNEEREASTTGGPVVSLGEGAEVERAQPKADVQENFVPVVLIGAAGKPEEISDGGFELVEADEAIPNPSEEEPYIPGSSIWNLWGCIPPIFAFSRPANQS